MGCGQSRKDEDNRKYLLSAHYVLVSVLSVLDAFLADSLQKCSDVASVLTTVLYMGELRLREGRT